MTTPSGTVSPLAPVSRAGLERLYLEALTWAFTLFSSLRVVTYLPAIFAIVASGESSQHSLWTWATWLCSNLTMAAWLWEQNRRRTNKAVWINLCNALMCALTVAVVAAYRI